MVRPAQTRGEQVIEQLMTKLDPESDRYRVLAVARRFKSTWAELGEQLVRVSREELFRQWGYDTFEAYCTREVRIRRPTAQKLTQAYRYLEQEEPELLARKAELRPLPDYRSVDLLRQAREEHDLPAEEYAALRRAVIDEERAHPTVRKRFLAAMDEERSPDGEERRALQETLTLARRLALALKNLPDLPREHADAAVRLIGVLEERQQRQNED